MTASFVFRSAQFSQAMWISQAVSTIDNGLTTGNGRWLSVVRLRGSQNFAAAASHQH